MESCIEFKKFFFLFFCSFFVSFWWKFSQAEPLFDYSPILVSACCFQFYDTCTLPHQLIVGVVMCRTIHSLAVCCLDQCFSTDRSWLTFLLKKRRYFKIHIFIETISDFSNLFMRWNEGELAWNQFECCRLNLGPDFMTRKIIVGPETPQVQPLVFSSLLLTALPLS